MRNVDKRPYRTLSVFQIRLDGEDCCLLYQCYHLWSCIYPYKTAADILGEFVFGDEVFLISFNSVLNHIFYPKLPYKYRLFRIIGKRFFHV